MTRNQFQTGNVSRGLFSLNCSFFKAATDSLNCCRFLYTSALEVQLAVLGQLHFFVMIRRTFLGQQICSKSSSLKI